MSVYDKIKEIVTLERDKTYFLIIEDACVEDVVEVTEALGDSYEKFGCKFIVASDRMSIEEAEAYSKKALGESIR